MFDIGQRIRQQRHALDMTQEELGKKIGVTKATINKYETGIVHTLPRPKIEALASALQITPAYLMGWTENNTNVNNGLNNGVIGQNYGTMSVSTQSKEEEELVKIFRKLDVRGRIDLLSYALKLGDKQ